MAFRTVIGADRMEHFAVCDICGTSELADIWGAMEASQYILPQGWTHYDEPPMRRAKCQECAK